jgi:hypothetical protein
LARVQFAFAIQDGGHDALHAELLGQISLLEIMLFHEVLQHFGRCRVRQVVMLLFVGLDLLDEQIKQRHERMRLATTDALEELIYDAYMLLVGLAAGDRAKWNRARHGRIGGARRRNSAQGVFSGF